MRVAFIVDAFPTISETFILNQITGLIDLGHQVVIFAGARCGDRESQLDIRRYNLDDKTYYHNEKPTNRWGRTLLAVVLLGYYFFKSPKTLLNSLNFFKYGRDAASLSLFYKAVLFTARGPFDILQCHFAPNGSLGVLLRELGVRGKVITMFHGYDIRRGIAEGKEIYAELFRDGDCFLSISDYNEKYLTEFGADPQRIVYHPVGIDLSKFVFRGARAVSGPKEPVKILTVARLIEVKGLNYALHAVSELVHVKGMRHVRYQVVGDGPLRGEMEELVEKLNIKPYVHFFGLQQAAGVIQLLRESDLFLLPSLGEALPVVLMEAQAVGLPVVATKVGSVHQVVLDGQSGFLVPPKDVGAMVDKLHELISHRETWLSMGEVGRRHIESHYDIHQLNKRLVSIYQECLAGHGNL
jgi:colanic acid/amylovoran biosynthesis glycosyltransferase